ncbi:MAG: GntR family transcriptional regulator [Burkholderiales bacterium]|nr:GntR family transcriptional regulator [Burkholderiales bacterium]
MNSISTNSPVMSRRPLYEDVAEALRQRIYARELLPGSWIDEQSICAAYGISRTPVREALKVLAAEGLVTMRMGRGAYVAEMSADDVSQIYQLLSLLESEASADVAKAASAQQLATLQRLHDALERQVGEREAFFATNEQFHMTLLEIAGNRWRIQIVADLRKLMKLNRHHSLLKQGRIDDSLAEHRQLMEALRQHDSTRAEQVMRRHFANGLQAAI